MRSSRLFTNLISLGLVSGCQDLPEIGEHVWTGEHVEIWASDGLSACGGSFLEVDRHAARLKEQAKEVGVPTDDAQRFKYYWFDESERDIVDTVCDGYACFIRDSVYSPSMPDFHEITHASIPRIAASDTPFSIAEGVATVFGNFKLDSELRTISPVLPPLQNLLDSNRPSSDEYPAAAHFVRLLLGDDPRAGASALVASDKGARYSEIRKASLSAGLPFDEVAVRYSEFTLMDKNQPRHSISECDRTPEPWTSGRLEISGALACEAHDSLGPFRGRIWRVHTFEVTGEEEQLFRMTWDSLSGIRFSVERCQPSLSMHAYDGATTRLAFLGDGPSQGYRFLAPGRYWIYVETRSDSIGDPSYHFQASPVDF